jgi:hypothetical protein
MFDGHLGFKEDCIMASDVANSILWLLKILRVVVCAIVGVPSRTCSWYFSSRPAMGSSVHPRGTWLDLLKVTKMNSEVALLYSYWERKYGSWGQQAHLLLPGFLCFFCLVKLWTLYYRVYVSNIVGGFYCRGLRKLQEWCFHWTLSLSK